MDSSSARRTQMVQRGLRFRKSLTSKLTTTELINRLTSLQQELTTLEQDTVDRESLSAVRDELFQPGLYLHKDKTVKALLACCLADLLRIYAPDAPFTLPELKDIFQFFFRQLRNLQSPTSQSPNHKHYLYLIDSLASVQSIVLVSDVPDAEDLITEIFKVLFTVVSTEMSQNFLLTFADLSAQIINATSPIVPSPVVKLLLNQFQPRQIKSNPAASRLAIDVCNACEDRLKQEVYRYFNELLAQGTRSAGFDPTNSDAPEDDLSDDNPEAAIGFKELEATHALIQTVYQPCPGLLQSVIPLLEVELQKNHVQLRLLAVQTLGQMFAEQPMGSVSSAQALNSLVSTTAASSNQLAFYNHQPIGADLARKYPNTWKMWLRRSADISPEIRVAIVRCCKSIISKQPHLSSDVNKVLHSKLADCDEKVRSECCKIFHELDFELALHHIDRSVLKALGGRIEDRKASVQQEALRSLGRFYNLAYQGIEADNPELCAKFSWIPQDFLSSMFVGDARLCAASENHFLKLIAPIPSSTTEDALWVDRLITITKYLDDLALSKLKIFARFGNKRPTGFDRYLDACEEYNGGVMNQNDEEIKKRLAQIIRVISTHFHDPNKAMEDLKKFAKLNDKRIYKLLRTMSDEQLDFAGMIKAHQEFRRRIKSVSASLAETVETFLHKSAYLILNSASIPTLLRRLPNGDCTSSPVPNEELGPDNPRTTTNCAKALLDMISTNRPIMLKAHIDDITQLIPDVSSTDLDEAVIEGCLLAASELAKADTDAIPCDLRTVSKMSHLALRGTRMQVKLAATVLAKCPGMESACNNVNERLATSLAETTHERLVSYMGALSRIAKHAPQIFETHGTTVTGFIVNQLVRKPSKGGQPKDHKWISDEELCHLSKARIEGLKVLTNRCIIYVNAKQVKTVSAPVFKLLWELIRVDEHADASQHSVAVALRFRAKAAQSLLKLASYPAFSREIEGNFHELALISQDDEYPVRNLFLTKLVRYLQQRRLGNPRYNVILFLVAKDPEKCMVETARESIISRLKFTSQRVRTTMFETIIVQLLHTLAYHPDFKNQTSATDKCKNFAKYIEFFVDCVGNSENVSLLYHLAGQLKTVQDARSKDAPDASSDVHNERLYTLSELAQLVIKTKAQEHHWALPTYPGQVKLPTDIFQPLPSELVQEVSKKTYLSEDFSKTYVSTKSSEHNRPASKPASKPATKRLPKTQAKRMMEKKKKRKLMSEDNNEGEEAVQWLATPQRKSGRRKKEQAVQQPANDGSDSEPESEHSERVDGQDSSEE